MTSQEERAREVLAAAYGEVNNHSRAYWQRPPDKLAREDQRALAAMLALAVEAREDAAKVADNTAHEARKLQARYTRDHPQWWANESIASAAEEIAAAIRAQGGGRG